MINLVPVLMVERNPVKMWPETYCIVVISHQRSDHQLLRTDLTCKVEGLEDLARLASLLIRPGQFKDFMHALAKWHQPLYLVRRGDRVNHLCCPERVRRGKGLEELDGDLWCGCYLNMFHLNPRTAFTQRARKVRAL